MNKKLIFIVISILLLCLGLGIWYFVGLNSKSSEPETWEGIYRGTSYISDKEREIIGVKIEEDNMRKIELTIKYNQGDVVMFNVDNSIELTLEKTGKISYSMKAVSIPEDTEISADEMGDVYVELEYIDKDTISIKYGDTEEKMKACKPIELQHSVE